MSKITHKHAGVGYELEKTIKNECNGCVWNKASDCARPLSVPSCIEKGGHYIWKRQKSGGFSWPRPY